jgi:hypothetical protein
LTFTELPDEVGDAAAASSAPSSSSAAPGPVTAQTGPRDALLLGVAGAAAVLIGAALTLLGRRPGSATHRT